MDYLILGICILICILVVFLLVALMFCNYMIDRNWISLYDLDNWIDFKYPECGGIFQAIRNYINYKN